MIGFVANNKKKSGKISFSFVLPYCKSAKSAVLELALFVLLLIR